MVLRIKTNNDALRIGDIRLPFLNCKWTRILWLRHLDPFAAHLRIELQFNTSKLHVVSTMENQEHNQTKDSANEAESAIEVNIVV